MSDTTVDPWMACGPMSVIVIVSLIIHCVVAVVNQEVSGESVENSQLTSSQCSRTTRRPAFTGNSHSSIHWYFINYHGRVFLLCPVSFFPGSYFLTGQMLKKNGCPVSSWHAFHIMPAILISVRNKRKFTITQNLPSTNIHWQNCRNSTAIRNIIYFYSHFTCLQHSVLLKPPNVVWMPPRKHRMWLAVTANPPLGSSRPLILPGQKFK